MFYYNVCIAIDVNEFYTYKSLEKISVGSRVIVQLKNSLKLAIVVKEEPMQNLKENIKYKEILEVLDQTPIISKELFELAKFISSYYQCPFGIAIFAILPSSLAMELGEGVKKEKGITLSNLSEDEKLLLAQLKDEKYLPIKELKTNLKKNQKFL